MSKLLKSHKKFKFVLHVIKIIIFTLSIYVKHYRLILPPSIVNSSTSWLTLTLGN